MLNQISKLKGNEIFSLVTPEGMDQYIISRDLIGNVLNVVEDILRKREQHQVVPPPSEDCEDAKRLAKDACNKASIAYLTSKDALDKTKHVLDVLNEVRYKSTAAFEKASFAETVSESVKFLSRDLNTVKSQVNGMVSSINNLTTNMVTFSYLDDIVNDINTHHSTDIAQLNQSIANLSITQGQQTSQLAEINSEIERIDRVLAGLEDISPQDIVNLIEDVQELDQREKNDIIQVNNKLTSLENSLGSVEQGSKVILTHSENTYSLQQGNTAIGNIVIPEVDSEVSDISENAVSNKAITEFVLQKEYVISAALVDLNTRLTAAHIDNERLLSENETLQQQVTTLSNTLAALEEEIFWPITGDPNDNPTTRVLKENSLNITLPVSAGDRTTLQSATVTMSGQDITSNCFDLSTRVINIPKVTGSVVISTNYSTTEVIDGDIFDDDWDSGN